MMLERDLSQPVSDWMSGMGFTPYAEVPFPMDGFPVDLIGRCDDELLTVELKRSLTERVIQQAAMCDLITDRRYAAVGTKPKAAGVERCRKLGIGLLSVVGGVVAVLVEPREIHPSTAWIRDTYRAAVLKSLDVMTPNGTGGVPCMKGIGPAQECYDRVQIYRAAHPFAAWREIFREVPNHYNDYKSMCGAMRIVGERRCFKSEPLELDCFAAPNIVATVAPASTV
jgi:hypothetical protein